MPTIQFNKLKRIAIFRALNLGDMLCAIPAIRALRTACPAAEIVLIGLPGMAGFCRRYSKFFDGFVSFPGAPGLPEQVFDFDDLIAFLQREREACYDLVLQMHGKGSIVNPLVSMLNAPMTAGYFEPGEYCPDTETYIPYPDGVAEVERHLRFMQFLGVEVQGSALEFPVTLDEWRDAEALRKKAGFPGKDYVCIHPGARDMRRWWAPQKFAFVADSLAQKGYQVIFTGSETERASVDHVRALMRKPSINLAGMTGLGVLGALIGQSRLLISNDTGVSHLAAAMATPSVVIFLASDPVRWAPLDRELHHIVLPEESDNVEIVISHANRVLRSSIESHSAL